MKETVEEKKKEIIEQRQGKKTSFEHRCLMRWRSDLLMGYMQCAGRRRRYREGKPFSNNFLFYKRGRSSALNSLSIILLKIISYDKQMIEIFQSALLLS